VWKTTPETCGKQVENFCYMALWGVTRIDRCFSTLAPKACTVNRLQKTCVQMPDKSFIRRWPLKSGL
jgi:hypothetical protein